MLPSSSEFVKAWTFLESSGLEILGGMRSDDEVSLWGHVENCHVKVKIFSGKDPEVVVTYCKKMSPEEKNAINALTDKVYRDNPRLTM